MSTVVIDETITTVAVGSPDNVSVNVSSEAVSIVEVGTQGPAGTNGTHIAVSNTAPSSPAIGDLWVDTA